MITPDEIRRIVERPSALPASASADEYLMEKFKRVAIEAAAATMTNMTETCPPTREPCTRDNDSNMDCCHRCWREWLEREPQ